MKGWHEHAAISRERQTVTAALYEAKIESKEIVRLLMKHCGVNEQEATNLLLDEKFILFPCRELAHYLVSEHGFLCIRLISPAFPSGLFRISGSFTTIASTRQPGMMYVLW